MKLLFIVSMLGPALLSAQPVTDSAAVYEIRGQVLDAETGAGVPHARVTLSFSKLGGQAGQRSEPIMLVTDPAGTFRVMNLPAGSANLSCSRSGYFEPASPKLPGADVILINRKDAVATVTLYLRREAVIRGAALDERGFALGGTVHAYRMALIDGHRRPEAASFGNVDLEGTFRITGLKPGRYYVAYFPNLNRGYSAKRVYRPMLYPGSADLANARLITVASGDEQQIEFRPVSTPACEISVKLPATAENANFWSHSVEVSGVPNPPQLGVALWYVPEHMFRVKAMPCGEYFIKAQWMQGGVWMSASKHIAVGGGNTTEISLESGNPGILPLVVSFDPPVAPQPMAFVQLLSESGTFSSNRDTSGNLSFSQLRTGIYALTGTEYFKSARQGGRDALREGVVVPEEGAPEPLEVVIGKHSGSFETILESIGIEPRENVHVAFLRQTPLGLHLEQQTIARAKENTVRLNQPPVTTWRRADSPVPGEYVVIAWTGYSTINELPYNEPEFLQQYSSVIERVTLGETEPKTVMIRHLLPASAFEQ